MRIKFFGLSAFMLLMTVSCKKDLSNLVETQPRHADIGDGDLDVLGYGYDMQGDYTSYTAAKRRVIDVRKMRNSRPSKIDERITNRQYFEGRSGSDFNEYTKNHSISVKVNGGVKVFGLKLFDSELRTKFGDSSTSSSTFSFATIDMMVEKKILEILDDDYIDIKSNFLDQDFVNDCNILSAQDLINRYGLGVLKKMKLGGKLSASYHNQSNSGNKKSDVEAGAKASFQFLFKFSVDFTGNWNSSSSYSTNNQLLKYETVGGSPGHSIIGSSTLGAPSNIDVNNWSSTVKTENSSLIGFYEDSFILLNELIPNADKASEVRELIYEKLGLINYVYSQGKLLAKIWGSPNLDDYAFTSFEILNAAGYNSHNQADYIMSHNVILNRGGTTYDNESYYTGLGAYKFSEWEASRTIGVEKKKLNPALKYKVVYKYSSWGSKPIPNFSSYQIASLPPAMWNDNAWYQATKTISGVASFEECCFVGKIVDDYVVYPEGSKVELYVYDRATGSVNQTLVFD